MGRGIDQRALVVLAVDLDQRGAERLEHLRADRLVVDEGAGAAVGELHAAQDQLVLGRDVVLRRAACAPDAFVGRSNAAVTWPCSAPWRTSATSPRAPSASAKASSRIDLPAPVSPVSTDEAVGEIDIEPVDQNDVADREPGEHGRPCMMPVSNAPASCGFAIISKTNNGRDKPGRHDVRKLSEVG